MPPFPWAQPLTARMLILFDHSVPAPLRGHLKKHAVTEAVERGWDRLSNGDLLTVAEAAGFDVLLTADNNLSYQQNLKERQIATVWPAFIPLPQIAVGKSLAQTAWNSSWLKLLLRAFDAAVSHNRDSRLTEHDVNSVGNAEKERGVSKYGQRKRRDGLAR